MSITRRKILESSVFAGASLGASRFLKTSAVSASPLEDEVVPAPTCEWTAATPASAYRAYRSKLAKSADSPTWVQIDLGASQLIDLINVYPANERLYPRRDEHYAGEGFPVRFKIEATR
jgi:uncharacterized protein